MKKKPNHNTQHDADRVLTQYMRRIDGGERVDRRLFIAQHPEVADDLRSYFDGVDLIDQIADLPTQLLIPGSARTLDLEGFQVYEEIGRGGMGIVYKARQISLDRKVAIKVLPPLLATDQRRLDRFRSEAALAANLTNAHVLPVIDIRTEQKVPVIVMPFVEGSDLGKIIRDRRRRISGGSVTDAHPWAWLSDQDYLERVLVVLDDVLEAMCAIHRAQIVHRDIKPSNILVDESGTAWLTDFGLATLRWEQQGTATAGPIGTPGFMSPEQAQGRDDIDYRSDIFGAGVTIYQALALHLPYGTKPPTLTQAPPRRPSKIQKRLSPDYDRVILKALEPDRSNRFQSSKELLDDWNRVRKGLLPVASGVRPLTRLSRWTRRNFWQLLCSVLLLAVLGLLAGRWLLPPAAPRPFTYLVQIETHPADAQGAMVPLGPSDGEPMPEATIRGQDRRGGLEFTEVPPGDYLVVVEVSGYGFHEVYRRVPEPKEIPSVYSHRSWQRLADNEIRLPSITIRESGLERGMAYFQGTANFEMGSTDLFLPTPPHIRQIAPFWLDVDEVSVAEFHGDNSASTLEQGRLPVTNVSFDEATAYAESVGKRLPTEAEYEYAATMAGTARFPWGDSEDLLEGSFGPEAKSEHDRTATDPAVMHLYSRVAEWTSSWLAPYPGLDETRRQLFFQQPGYSALRVVRGGPYSVLIGKPKSQETHLGPRFRHGITRDHSYPGLGFRCARSSRARYLNTGP